MKHTIEFNLPDDREELNAYLNAEKTANFIEAFKTYYRNVTKYDQLPKLDLSPSGEYQQIFGTSIPTFPPEVETEIERKTALMASAVLDHIHSLLIDSMSGE